MKTNQFKANAGKINHGINYFINRRDYYIGKMRETANMPAISIMFQEKANDMQNCLERYINRKYECQEALN